MNAASNQRVQEFERHLDDALAERAVVRSGGSTALHLAANIVETAYAERWLIGERLAEGLQILAPSLVGRGSGSELDVAIVYADLDFAAHYHVLRDLLYYTYNAPGTMEWTFGVGEVKIRFIDPSLPRQFYLSANNWFLESMSKFSESERIQRIQKLVRGQREFELTESAIQAQELILEEVDLKLGLYFNFVTDTSVSAGGYTYEDFFTVYRALLVKALYHRYHAQVNGSSGIISMSLDDLGRDLESSVEGVSSEIARAIVRDISYGTEARESKIDPVYFSLYQSQDDEILMLPYHFATWEGIVSFLRLVALRSPQLFLQNYSQQIGSYLVERIAKAFVNAGFTVRSNVALSSYRTELPDIDLLVISEEPTLGYVILVCEVKSPLPPRWAKDQLRVLEADSIAKAFEQLRKIGNFLGSDEGLRFISDQLPKASIPNFDEFAVLLKMLVATSDNAGAFFEDRGIVIDFRMLERLLNRCDGDMHYVLEVLNSFPEWADNGLERKLVNVQVGDTAVSYEGVAIKHLMDFGQAAFRTVGAPERMVNDMLEAGDRPLDVFRERGVKFD